MSTKPVHFSGFFWSTMASTQIATALIIYSTASWKKTFIICDKNCGLHLCDAYSKEKSRKSRELFKVENLENHGKFWTILNIQFPNGGWHQLSRTSIWELTKIHFYEIIIFIYCIHVALLSEAKL